MAGYAGEEAWVREAHIKQVLLAIRNVNQLIVQEMDPQRLIERACDNLTDTLGYSGAWIALLSPEGRVTATAFSGLDLGFDDFRRQLEMGWYPRCMTQALECDGVAAFSGRQESCPECVLSEPDRGCVRLAHRLAFGEKTYGVLAVSVPVDYVYDEEEQGLFVELANDLAFALNKIEAEERRAALEREQAFLLRSMINAFVIFQSVFDGQGRFVSYRFEYINEAYERITGVTLEQVRGRTVHEIWPETEASWIENYGAVATTGVTRTFEMFHGPTDKLYNCTVYRPWDSPERFCVVFEDITERKRAEEALRKSETLLRESQAVAHLGSWELDLRCNRLTWSDEVFSIFGLHPQEFAATYDAFLGAVHPDDREAVDGAYRRSLHDVGTSYEFEHRIIRKTTGEIRHIHERCVHERDASGAVVRSIGMVHDITERRTAEEQLRQSETLFRRFFETNNNYCYMITPEGTILDVNPAALAVLGYDREELIGQPAAKIYAPESQARRLEVFEAWRRTGSAHNEELILLTKAGERRTVLLSAGHVLDPAGRSLHSVSIQTDITERKEAEEALRRQETVLNNAERLAHVGAWVYEVEQAQFQMSKEWRRIHGVGDECLGIEDLPDLVHPDDLPLIVESLGVAISSGVPYDVQHRVIRRDSGQVRLVRASGEAVRDASGQVTQIFGASQDITELMQAEVALRDSTLRLEAAVTAGNVGLWDWDLATNRVFYSREWKRQIGYEENEIGDGLEEWESRVHPEDLGPTQDKLATRHKANEPHVQVEFRFRHKDGSYRWILAESSTIRDAAGHPVRMLGSHLDITARREVENALRESEERFRAVSEHSHNAICIIDEQARIVWVNDRLIEISGYTRGQIMEAESFAAFVAPESLPFVMENYQKFLSGQPYVHHYQFRFRRADGEIRLLEKHMADFTNTQGKRQLVASMLDVTERKQAEEERERLLSAIEQAGESIVITDRDGTIQYVNPAFETITGYTRYEAVGQNPRMLKSGEHDAAFYRGMWHTLTGGKIWQGKLINKRKDGTRYVEDATISPVCDASGVIVNYVGVKRDMTHEVRLEEQYRQAQKMESVGRLAGGVAHDFNNMLAVILGHADMALNKLPPSDPLCDNLREIVMAGERSAEIAGQLLAFARKQDIAPKVLNLNDSVGKMLKMLARLIGEDIDLLWKPGLNLWRVMMDPAQLSQVLANLVVNARDAIGGVGRIAIETSNIYLSEQLCAQQAEAVCGDYVMLVVSDNGSGMDKQTLENIFDPFFTTKPPGEGTGLGLATVYGIVRQNAGFIRVDSEPGVGTTFRIYIPRFGDATDDTSEHEETPELPTGTETILLVEDEELLLDLASRLLKELGYAVIATGSPVSALQIASDPTQHLDLLMTDVVMPDMSGRELWNQISALRPEAKCVYMSGYTADVIAHRGILEEGVHFLQKPFNVFRLAAIVREALQQA